MPLGLEVGLLGQKVNAGYRDGKCRRRAPQVAWLLAQQELTALE